MTYVKFDPYKYRKSEGTPATSATPATPGEKTLHGNGFSAYGELLPGCYSLLPNAKISDGVAASSKRVAASSEGKNDTRSLVSNAFSVKVAEVAEVAGVPSDLRSKSEFLVPQENRETIDLTAFDERAAVLEHEAGLTRQEAEVVAAVELGHHDDAAFYREQIYAWQREIKALPRPNMKEGQALVRVSLDFLASEWAHKALAAGWGEIEIFGLFDGPWPAPRSRYDAQGLVPAIALSAFKLTIAELNESAAILTSRTGSRLRHPRDLPGAQYCRAWWFVLRGDV